MSFLWGWSMLLQVFLLGLFSAFASDFLTLVTNIDLIKENNVITCDGKADSFDPVHLWVNEEVPTYRVAPYCLIGKIRFNGKTFKESRRFATFDGFLLYVCASGHTRKDSVDEICGFHDEGTLRSLHVVYKGAKMNDRVFFGKNGILEFDFRDIYYGNDMSYVNFVGVLYPFAVSLGYWEFGVGTSYRAFQLRHLHNKPGVVQVVTGDGDDILVSYVYPDVNEVPSDYNDPFVLSVGVFGTLRSLHCVHSCVKGAPDGHCMHSSSKTFNKGGSDMLTMALPNDMETYYFEYSVFEFSGTVKGGVYDRVIFMTSVVDLDMVDSYQRRVVLSSEHTSGIFVAGNLRRCNGDYETCVKDDKKSFTLTFLGYTTAQEVQKLIVHGGEITVVVEDGDCQEVTSQCVVTIELFAYRNIQVWVDGMRKTHNGVINPDDSYRAMIFQDLTIVIEPEE